MKQYGGYLFSNGEIFIRFYISPLWIYYQIFVVVKDIVKWYGI